ncbi:SDR family oxidoreductase [Candidatus Aerophobetes bacterium]|nr:SDR family oxidoreductase [Candidatus Aerophobetes bacterium]
MNRINSLFDLRGRVAIVTGAASGLGRAMAIGLAKAGADIVVADINADSASETSELIRETGQKSIVVGVDVTDSRQVDKMVKETLHEFGKVDILINSAGIVRSSEERAPLEEVSEADWNRMIQVNLTGTFLCAQRVGREMIKQRRGKIINIASMSGMIVNKGLTGVGVYCVSKAGVIMLTKALAVEWAKYNINVNCISPGYMKTPMTQKTRSNPVLSKIQLEMTPLQRYGEPEEIVGAAIFLSSDASSFMTGSNIVIDGGYTAW